MKLTNQQRMLIEDVLTRLRRNIDNRETQRFVTNLMREEYKDELQHRNGWCSGRSYPKDFSPLMAAKLLTVQHIFCFVFDGVPLPSLKDSLRLKYTYVRGAAIAAEFEEVIKEQVTDDEAAVIRSLDYVQLCEGEVAA